nr:PREDICTED: solute carrier organic anion transporter family member 2B1-like [Bemisia tabaci]XP_018907629.1 PREDICTED: solute carrier organic anion transporter family member 2B1-like [Bemisia tabaci]
MKENTENGYQNATELDKMLPNDKDPPDATQTKSTFELTEDTTCGYWCFRGPFLQKFANKTAYVILYGMLGTVYSATFAYFSGSITTMEKRFSIPSRNIGIITVGNDIVEVLLGGVLGYYAGKGHRPRFIALGTYTVVIFCYMNALPYFIYGAGEKAEALTVEFGSSQNPNYTRILVENEASSVTCQSGKGSCREADGTIWPQIILFCAQLIAGIGGSLFGTLGFTYMDDNTKKSTTPLVLSVSYFLRTLGPALGYGISSLTMKMYINPSLTPTIGQTDPRWLGAWWIGWLILGTLLAIMGSLVSLFPKVLPKSAQRKQAALAKNPNPEKSPEEEKASFRDMLKTFRRISRTPILICNYLANICFFFGYSPFYYFLPKYMENIYNVSASNATLVTGVFGLGFSAMGLLVSGIVITKFKPKARYLAGWNVFSATFIACGLFSFSLLGCPSNEIKETDITTSGDLDVYHPCNQNCHCEFVKFSPVCHQPTNTTFISPCLAGCTGFDYKDGMVKSYSNCSCIPSANETMSLNWSSGNSSSDDSQSLPWSSVVFGKCPVDCSKQFFMFLAITCLNKFVGATSRASNFLISVRSVREQDKSVAIGFGMTLYSLFAFIPSPIMFGALVDKTCLVWGKTCGRKGNCWLYNNRQLKNIIVYTATALVSIGLLFDLGVWFYSKELKIFDEEPEKEPEKKEKRSSIIKK